MQLSLQGVGYRYDRGSPALFEDISVTWDSSTFNAIQGPSGSGKSTLLDIMGGLRAPSAGSLRLAPAEDPLGSALNRRDATAWILQNNLVLSGRSVLDNVLIGASARGVSPRSARASAIDAIEYLGLGARLSAVVNELSGGEQQRVTIARCLCSPSLLILADEPTGNLDATNAALVADGLRSASRAGKLVVVATHDQDVVDACDSSLALRATTNHHG